MGRTKNGRTWLRSRLAAIPSVFGLGGGVVADQTSHHSSAH
jgi:hypothetical protein